MPNRILRPGIITSDRVNSLTPQGEVFYRRLMSIIDDYGRYDARPAILRGDLYALQLERVREADLVRWITECEKANLIRLYTVGSKPYLEFLNLGPRRKNPSSKWPIDDLRAVESNCAQLHAMVTGTGTGTGTGSRSETGARDAPPVEPVNSVDSLESANTEARKWFDSWSGLPPPVGRGHGLKESEGEVGKVFELVGILEQETPIPRNGALIGRHLLIPHAVDVLMKKNCEFKGIPFARGCVKRELEDWATRGEPKKKMEQSIGRRFKDG